MALRYRLLLGVLLWVGFGPTAGLAQVPPDTTATDTVRVTSPSDSLATDAVLPEVPTDTLPPAPPIDPILPVPGVAVDTVDLVRTRFSDLASWLGEQAGTFTYTLGPPGWPDGWSAYGLNPRYAGLTLNGLSMDDLIDGRPRFDLLPFDLLAPVHLDPAYQGHSTTVHTAVRAFQELPPYTELRYHSGGGAFQYISGMHVQDRQRTLFGRPGRLNVLFRYGGQGSSGEYANSKARLRQVYLRLRYHQNGWMAELSNGFTKWNRGAHGGVIPPTANFDSIYDRFLASVRLPSARRTDKRNDLAFTLRMRWSSAFEPFTASAYWTSQIARFVNTDTLHTRSYRYGYYLQQPLPEMLGHRLSVRLEGWSDRLKEQTVFTDAPKGRTQLHLSARDEIRLFGSMLSAEAGLHRVGSVKFTSLHARWAMRGWFAEGAMTGVAPSWIELYGWGGHVIADPNLDAARVMQVRVGVQGQAGSFDVGVFGFVNRTSDPIEWFATTRTDTVQVVQLNTDLRRAGLGGQFGWRRAARRGFYLTLCPSAFVLLNADDTAETERVDATLPRFTIDGRLGMRYRLFNDLDLNLYVRGRYWTDFRSRTFHPQTSLLVLPGSHARIYGPSGTVDVFMEGGLRGATVFLAYENALSGSVYPGTLIVPVYPLPEQNLRFGVYWPIND